MAELGCPKCGRKISKVIDTRSSKLGTIKAHRRRRECLSCNHRWTTYEMSDVEYKAIRSTVFKEIITSLSIMVKRNNK